MAAVPVGQAVVPACNLDRLDRVAGRRPPGQDAAGAGECNSQTDCEIDETTASLTARRSSCIPLPSRVGCTRLVSSAT